MVSVIVTGTVSQENKAFNASQHIISTPRYSKFEMQALLEYGVTDRFTLMLAPGYQHVDIAAPTSMSRNGPGYSEFGGRYKFLDGDSWVFSGQATVRAPAPINITIQRRSVTPIRKSTRARCSASRSRSVAWRRSSTCKLRSASLRRSAG